MVVSPIYATSSLIIGFAFGLILRRLYRIDAPTVRFIYDIPRVSEGKTIQRSRGWIVLTYLGYLALSLSPMLAFFMCDIRIDSDVVSVPARYILDYCRDVRRYVSTEYYPLGLAMSEVTFGAFMFAAIVIESKIFLSTIPHVAEPENVRRRIFHATIIYCGQIFCSATYTILAMTFRFDVFWIYLMTLIVTIIGMLIVKRQVRTAIVLFTGRLTNLRAFICCLCWPCFRNRAINTLQTDGGDGSDKKK